MIDTRFISFLLLLISNMTAFEVSLTQDLSQEIGKKIWKNECAGSIEKLVFWNPHEDCISLGIGHFIWYPETVEKKFYAIFPEYLTFLKNKQVPLPKIIANTAHAPWKTREEFLSKEKTAEVIALKKWFYETIDLQTEFIVIRLSSSLDQILKEAKPHEKTALAQTIKTLTITPSGLFALIDYLNFKGDGLSKNERYGGKGWGLYQVLMGMSYSEDDPLDEFKASAIARLTERVQASPKEKNESRFLLGWINRISRY